jgi:hypothetical protein
VFEPLQLEILEADAGMPDPDVEEVRTSAVYALAGAAHFELVSFDV